EAVHNALAAGLVEVDGELVAVDLGDMAVAELLVEDALAQLEARARGRGGGHQLALDGHRTLRAGLVVAAPLLLGALPAERGVAAGEAGARLLEAAAAVRVVPAAAGNAVRAPRLDHLDVRLGQLVDEARRRGRLPQAAVAPVLHEAHLGLAPRT